jgi:DMSO reductase anchor subunit
MPAQRPFDEWPLVVFSTLAIAGAGVMAASPLQQALGTSMGVERQTLALRAAAVMAAGLLVSLGHLGRKRRAPYVSRRVGSNWLSTEVALAGATIIVAASLAVFPYDTPATRSLTWVGGVLAAAFLLSLGLVYRLPGQLTWGGPTFLTPLVLGLAVGVVVQASPMHVVTLDRLARLAVVLAADGVILAVRWSRVATLPPSRFPQYPAIYGSRHSWLAARAMLVDVLPMIMAAMEQRVACAASLGLGLLVDRLTFYGLAVQLTTESEISGVEALIEKAQPGRD